MLIQALPVCFCCRATGRVKMRNAKVKRNKKIKVKKWNDAEVGRKSQTCSITDP